MFNAARILFSGMAHSCLTSQGNKYIGAFVFRWKSVNHESSCSLIMPRPDAAGSPAISLLIVCEFTYTLLCNFGKIAMISLSFGDSTARFPAVCWGGLVVCEAMSIGLKSVNGPDKVGKGLMFISLDGGLREAGVDCTAGHRLPGFPRVRTP